MAAATGVPRRVVYTSSSDEVSMFVWCDPKSYNLCHRHLPESCIHFKDTLAAACTGVARVPGHVAVIVVFCWEEPGIRDLDNFVKLVLDGFQNRIFDDDRNVYALDIQKRMGADAMGRTGVAIQVLPISRVVIKNGILMDPVRVSMNTLPPSVNAHYARNKGRLFVAPKSTAFMNKLAAKCKSLPHLHGPVEMLCHLTMRYPQKRDLDNCLKDMLDGMKNRIIDDDSAIFHIVMYKTQCDDVSKQNVSFIISRIT